MSPAHAQDRRPWTLFDIFRPEPRRAPPERERIERFPDRPVIKRQQPPKRTNAATRPNRPRAAPARVAAPAVEEPVAIEKAANARTVLVVGDFLGSGLAEGLTAQFAQDANVRIVDKTKGSSGLVREDVYNWQTSFAALIEEEKPAAVVVMMGSNDRQPLRTGDTSQQPGSDAWSTEYTARATRFAQAIESSKVPFLWVGMPAFKSARMTSDMLAFNDVYKAATLANKGEFVDIWDGFTDENGAFVTTGPDVNGQPARLRGADGINLTRAGKAKIAFYADRPLRRILGIGGPAIATPLPQGPALPGDEPKATDRTPPMSLHDPELDGGTELLGAQPASAPAAVQPQPVPSPGRADDNSWTRKQAERPVASPAETTSAIPAIQ